MFSVMFVITMLLVKEYRFFKRQAEDLGLLKEDYNNYILALRRVLLDYEHSQEKEEMPTGEKKNLTSKINL